MCDRLETAKKWGWEGRKLCLERGRTTNIGVSIE